MGKARQHLGSVCFGRQVVLLSNTLALACPLSASLSSRSCPGIVIGYRSHVTKQPDGSRVNGKKCLILRPETDHTFRTFNVCDCLTFRYKYCCPY